jgi:hypothetical protein
MLSLHANDNQQRESMTVLHAGGIFSLFDNKQMGKISQTVKTRK